MWLLFIYLFIQYLNICHYQTSVFYTYKEIFKEVITSILQQEVATPVALSRNMRAVILIVVSPRSVMQYLTASFLFFYCWKQRGVCTFQVFKFWSATWQGNCQLPVTLHATSFNKCQLYDPAANPWQAGWPCQQAGGPTQCLDLALVTRGKWSEPLFCLFRGPPGGPGSGSPNKNITLKRVCACVASSDRLHVFAACSTALI